MGCHTWFYVPVLTKKEDIIKEAQKALDENKWLHPTEKQMYQYAIDNELNVPIKQLLSDYDDKDIDEWIMYQDVTEWSLNKYNKEQETNIERYDTEYHKLIQTNIIECYSDEPRIGGYPETIIKSYQEMLDFMKTGYTNDEGKHYDFYYEEGRYPNFIEGIKTFFEKHPDGIITFG